MQIVSDIQHILRQAQQRAVRSINGAMLQAYWLIGRRIVEEEQAGDNRSEYGRSQMKKLSGELKTEFGKGFSVDNLQNMRRFYAEYQKPQTLSAELGIEELQKAQTLSAQL